MPDLPPNPANIPQVPPPAPRLLGEVEQLTTHVMGITPTVIRAVCDNGWIVLLDFDGFTESEISIWISTCERRTLAGGGCNLGSIAIRKFKALSYWIDQQVLQ